MNVLQIIKPGTYWCNYSAIAWPDNSSGSNRCMDDKSIKPNYNIYLNVQWIGITFLLLEARWKLFQRLTTYQNT